MAFRPRHLRPRYNDFVTAWIPLQPIPLGGTGLLYAEGSHRDLARPFWYNDDAEFDEDRYDGRDDPDRYDLVDHGALALGDVSWHHGWTLHSASENNDPHDRFAFPISYFADDGKARLTSYPLYMFERNEDMPSHAAWLDDFDIGDNIVHDHFLLPSLSSSSSSFDDSDDDQDALLA